VAIALTTLYLCRGCGFVDGEKLSVAVVDLSQMQNLAVNF
jgi:hypothetical protein